jgi:hypothetical protein
VLHPTFCAATLLRALTVQEIVLRSLCAYRLRNGEQLERCCFASPDNVLQKSVLMSAQLFCVRTLPHQFLFLLDDFDQLL